VSNRIAWIEDDHPEISSLVRLLELDGYDILRYRTCQEVEKHLEDVCKCNAVILDIILPPPMDDDPYQGVSLLRKLRKECGYNGPVVICSVVRNPDVLRALRQLGVSDILHKPVRPSKLYDTVTKLIEHPEP
jgi:DNA-binding response OmpR family regulator